MMLSAPKARNVKATGQAGSEAKRVAPGNEETF
jgi:hypothetical protein